MASLAMAASASAQTILVDSAADDNGAGCTLREALNNANTDSDGSGNGCATGSGDDSISFAQSLTGPINLDSAKGELPAGAVGFGELSIQRPGTGGLTVSGQDAVRVFHVPLNAPPVSITGLKIAHGRVAVSSGGTASARGGGILADDGTDLTLDHVVLDNNQVSAASSAAFADAEASGAGVASFSVLHVVDSTISQNTASASGTSLVANTTLAWGGGIWHYQAGGSVSVLRSTINGNSAASTVTATPGNTEQAYGGGVLSNAGATTINESTIDSNSASVTSDPNGAQGGGVWANGTSFTMDSDTITRNAVGGSTGQGANIEWLSAVPSLQNTIVAQPTGGPNCHNSNGDPIGTAGHNFADDTSCNPNAGLGDKSNFDANSGLGLLQNNGGPTLTRLPAPYNSLAPNANVIDQGITTDGHTFDQRNKSRYWLWSIVDGPGSNGADVGAVEVEGADNLAISPASPSDDTTPTITGTSDGDVQLYENSCSPGTQLGTQTSGPAFTSAGITIGPLPVNSATAIVAGTTYGDAVSTCTSAGTYAVKPTPPVLTSNPASGSNNNAPLIQGTTLAGTTVDFYANASCSGSPAASGLTPAQLTAGLPQSVADNSTTSFSATATGVGGTSACSAPFTYAEVTPPPAATTPTPTPAPKKCKKGKKLKKGKCVKKKKKKK